MVALPGDPTGTDPALTDNLNANMVYVQVIEGLMGFAPGSSEVVPVLATDYQVSDDALTYTFKLREGVKFHDGTAFDSAAVKATFDRLINFAADLQPRANGDLRGIGGFGENANIASVEAPDPQTAVFTLRTPQSNLLSLLAMPAFAIQSPTALAAGKADNTETDPTKISALQGGEGAMVGTGPFKFKEWVPNDHLTIERNADYWNADGQAYLDTVIYKPITDSSASVNALQTGEVDIVLQLAPSDVPVLQGNADAQLITRPESKGISDLRFNLSFDSVKDVRVREAIGYALNRESYVQAFHAGFGEVPTGWMPVGADFFKAEPLEYDPEKAKALLKEAGAEGRTIDFYYPTDVSRPYMPDPRGLFQAITRDLEAVGLKIEPHGLPWSPDYLEQAATAKLSMYLMGMVAPQTNPQTWFGPGRFRYLDGKPSGYYSWENQEVQDLMAKATVATDQAEATELWGQVQDIIRKDLPSIPLVNPIVPGGQANYVKGFVPAGSQLEYLNTVWLDQ
ncbi:MAG: ABC transporter substrate-binding protein [Propionicimonas sp.]